MQTAIATILLFLVHGVISNSIIIMPDENGNLRLCDLNVEVHRNRAVNESEVNLLLFTRENMYDPIIMGPMDAAVLLDSPYNVSKRTMFAVHGWTGNADSPSSIHPKNATLEMEDCNVIVVDWEIPAGGDFAVAKANVPEVGAFVAKFITDMQEQVGLDLNDVTLFGHSLGAHVVGVVGGLLDGNVAAIVGSDPAGPGYGESEPLETKLDPSDAKFVQIIHTNQKFLGINTAIGDADFYPNGGDEQPGCVNDPFGFCSHNRAWNFYTESILAGGFTSVLCDSVDNLPPGNCTGNPTSFLGRTVLDTTASGDYYLTTNAEPPYSQG